MGNLKSLLMCIMADASDTYFSLYRWQLKIRKYLLRFKLYLGYAFTKLCVEKLWRT